MQGRDFKKRWATCSEVGGIWQACWLPIGAAFQDTFTAIAKAINVAIEALNRFLGIGTEERIGQGQ